MNKLLLIVIASVSAILLSVDGNGNEVGECRESCNKYVDPKFLKQCNYECALLKKDRAAAADLNSCVGRCGENYDNTNPCHCNDLCPNYGNCCNDYNDECKVVDLNSCVGRCQEDYDSSNPCHCNDLCPNYGNCCSDYDHECSGTPGDLNSCVGRCHEDYDPSNPCHCNDLCSNHGNCCSDYNDNCGGSSDGVTDNELLQIGTELWEIEVSANGNAADPSKYTLNKQQQITDSSNLVDLAPQKLFTYFDETLLTKSTYAAYFALLDNFIASTGNSEDVTSAEQTEIDTFLDEVLVTDLMKTAHAFLVSKNLASQTTTDFKNELKTLWFDLYSRSSGAMDSSGFEHVFAGEIKNGAVSGFHNWIEFYYLEKKGDLNYYGYFEEAQPQLLSFRFEWSGVHKKISSMFHGTSPELELALYTVCFYSRPDSLCRVKLDGNTVSIQTYTLNTVHVGSAYPSI